MTIDSPSAQAEQYWFVGYDDTSDLLNSNTFLTEGFWQASDSPRNRDLVKQMRPGEHVALKVTYTTKNEIPFDNHDRLVSVMEIKAIGVVETDSGDGLRIPVRWEPLQPSRRWYFYTLILKLWKVTPRDWMTNNLIDFAFRGGTQDIERFLADPFWTAKYVPSKTGQGNFEWTRFYEAIADALLVYRNDRPALVEGLSEIAARTGTLLKSLAGDRYADGSVGFVRDICPFTTMGLFNKGLDANRIKIATELAKLLGVDVEVPSSFEGVPVLMPLSSWYFPFEKDRDSSHIDTLWEVFEQAMALADDESDGERSELGHMVTPLSDSIGQVLDGSNKIRNIFAESYGRALRLNWVAKNLTFGFFWARPWSFLSLDQFAVKYLNEKLEVNVAHDGPKGMPSGLRYVELLDQLGTIFSAESTPVTSFVDLSYQAWIKKSASGNIKKSEQPSAEDSGITQLDLRPPLKSYATKNIVEDGCFVDEERLDQMIERLREKKNLILQGPPGTGKTWLSKRLAYALIGSESEDNIRVLQFHPNISYEDFVRGWRPGGIDGRLTLVDGPFMQIVKAAQQSPQQIWVVVIEEINRGNPAQIFGELLTLLEVSKRNATSAIELAYPDPDGHWDKVYLPENLYVIGTMNLADRSLALVDLALRRRFAFIDLVPEIGERWRDWVINKLAMPRDLADIIMSHMNALNKTIAEDARLGKHFRVGHSYVTPDRKLAHHETKRWFQQVVDTEIGPLLEEYWFDALDQASEARTALLAAI